MSDLLVAVLTLVVLALVLSIMRVRQLSVRTVDRKLDALLIGVATMLQDRGHGDLAAEVLRDVRDTKLS